ncbi:GntR family transcriptional regulator [Streptomyces sp. NP160]|uniref:GntR family transcriptional regulator n=1 Tax=Streptomyces sp. NP160 TaxID=2586637 RepID=UPI00214C3787|nr:winged helix-turn-helix domain-containing protein [Streptomyces sp. NP160]
MAAGSSADHLVVHLDRSAGAPAPWQQVHDQVAAAVDGGRLVPGDRLPTVRALAERLGVAAGTVARAYRALEASDVVSTASRAGTVVRDPSAQRGDAAARAAAASLAREAVAAGLDDDAALSLLRGALAAARGR